MNVDLPTPVSPNSSTLISSTDGDESGFGGRCNSGECDDVIGPSNSIKENTYLVSFRSDHLSVQ